ncbi:Dipeptide transport system permease protein DppC [Streptomyces sp. MA5143a]|nr:Dipeptide transport system permease protein DppC [Streptomyces sp. MA5143a]
MPASPWASPPCQCARCVSGPSSRPSCSRTAASVSGEWPPHPLPPSVAHPFGTDALGRDLLARLGHGALRTVGVALAVTAVCTLTGLLLGMAAQVGAGLGEVVSTMTAVLAGMLTTAVTGSSASGAALAVSLVGWIPYAAQAAAPLEQERAGGHLLASLSFGAGPDYLLRHHLLPAVLPPACATPSCACPPPSSSWPPWASSALANGRPPQSGAACCRRTSRTPNWRPGPYSARQAHSPCSPSSPCPTRTPLLRAAGNTSRPSPADVEAWRGGAAEKATGQAVCVRAGTDDVSEPLPYPSTVQSSSAGLPPLGLALRRGSARGRQVAGRGRAGSR